MTTDRPNILIFMPDQMLGDVVRPDHPCITPNFDRLVKGGVLFTNTFCTTAHCCPSRASFQTGEYPSVHGVWNNVSNRCAINRDMTPGIQTLGNHLKAAGYNLGYSGKWHVSDNYGPSDFGWEEYTPWTAKRGWERSRIDAYNARQGEETGVREGPGMLKRPGWGDLALYKSSPDEDAYVGELNIINSGIKSIQEMAKQDGPWCSYISCNSPHDAYHPAKRYLDMYKDMEIPLPESFEDTLADKPRIYQRMRNQYWNQLSPEETRESVIHYYAFCTMVDEWFGRIMDALEATGQADNTLILVTSDHGDYAGAHGLWCKGVPSFREGYAIPNIMHWPKGIENPGRVQEELVSAVDFMPTLVELATGEAPDVYGDSLLPILRDEEADWRDELHIQMNGVELYYTQRVVRTQRWKYVYNGFDFDEMYDLENDPHEMVNLAFPDRYEQKPSAPGEEFVPWPRLTPELEQVRKEMYARMWRFARAQQDHFMYTPYLTTAQAAYGPLYAFEDVESLFLRATAVK
jgi:arylsulfatase A-like enzyme